MDHFWPFAFNFCYKIQDSSKTYWVNDFYFCPGRVGINWQVTNDNYCLSSLNTSHRVGARPKIKLLYSPTELLFCRMAGSQIKNWELKIDNVPDQICTKIHVVNMQATKRIWLSEKSDLPFPRNAPAISCDRTCHLGLTHLRYRLGIAIGKIGSTQSKCQSLAFQKISLSIFGKLFVQFQNALFEPVENWHFATV